MANNYETACPGMLRAWARVLAIVAVLAAGAIDALAQGRRAPTAATAHRSHYVVPPGAQLPFTRQMVLGVDKSMLVELPVDVANIMVSNPEVLDAIVQSPRQVYLLGKDFGEANVFFEAPGGAKVLLLEMTVARDLSTLVGALQRLLPGSRIRAEMVGTNVVLSGTVDGPEDASRAADLAARFIKKKDAVVNMLASRTKQQVLLRIKVAEMQREAIRRIGVDLPGALLRSGNFSVAEVIANGFPVTTAAGAVAGAIGALPTVTTGKALQGGWQRGNQSVSVLMQMLEQAGALRTLAEPNLTAISGETAKFLAGGEFPIPISQANNTISVEYKQFGVNVSFKPIVLGAGRISLKISAEVSELADENSVSTGSLVLRGLKVRRAETTLELPSGGTLAMAGLLSDDMRKSVQGVPGLKELPVLGALFRSNDYRRRETELVILVTPVIVTHGRERDFGVAGKGFEPEGDLRELFLGRLNRVYGRPGAVPPGRYRGDFGYIIEYPEPGLKG